MHSNTTLFKSSTYTVTMMLSEASHAGSLNVSHLFPHTIVINLTYYDSNITLYLKNLKLYI